MTTVWEALEGRGLDVELCVRLGFGQGAGGELVIPFVRNGATVRRKFRTFAPKRFWQDEGGVRCLWNEDALRDDTLDGQPWVITEGELDAVAAIQSGFARATSVPDGAPPPGERTAQELAGSGKYAWLDAVRELTGKARCPTVILAVDGDPNGAALMHDLSVLLGRARCKFVTYPKARDPEARGRERLKDLNEVLEDYGAKGVRETLARAQWLQVDGVYRMSELPPLPPQQVYEPRFSLFRENFKLRLGDFSVVTGTPGFGKSTFANDLICGLAVEHGLNVAWASFEQAPQRDHKRNLRSWFCQEPEHRLDAESLAAADRWIDDQHAFIVPGEEDDPDLEWLIDKMETAAVRFGANVFVIDPWNELEHSRDHGETETEYTGRAIRTLKRFAKAFQAHVMVVAHPTKSVKDAEGKYKMPTLYDIAGSANWYNKAELGVIVHRENEHDTLIKVQKSRYHEVIGKPGEVMMQFCRDTRRFTETERVA